MGGPVGGGEHPDDWWSGEDGTWFPPSAAHHPAARHEQRPAANGTEVGRTPRQVWLVRAAIVVPFLLVGGLLLVVVGPVLRSDVSDTATTAQRPSSSTVDVGDESPSTAITGPPSGSTSGPAATGSGPASATSTPSSPPSTPASDSPPAPATTSAPPAAATTSTPPTSAPPPTHVPTDKDQCKHGGWQDLVDDHGRPFANQGECVAFVQRQD